MTTATPIIRTSRAAPRRRCGVTLVELVITLLVMGLLAAVAVPRVADSITRHRAEAAARRIQSDLELARHAARNAGRSRTVTFDTAAHRYTLSGVTDPNHPGQPYVVDLAATGYPATLDAVSLGPTGAAAAVTFDMYGRPDAGGSVVVRSGDEQRTVTLDAATGQARIN